MLLDAILTGLIVSALSTSIQVWMEDGMILSWYTKMLKRFPKWLAMPLGLCAHCNVVWLAIAAGFISGYGFYTIFVVAVASFATVVYYDHFYVDPDKNKKDDKKVATNQNKSCSSCEQKAAYQQRVATGIQKTNLRHEQMQQSE